MITRVYLFIIFVTTCNHMSNTNPPESFTKKKMRYSCFSTSNHMQFIWNIISVRKLAIPITESTIFTILMFFSCLFKNMTERRFCYDSQIEVRKMNGEKKIKNIYVLYGPIKFRSLFVYFPFCVERFFRLNLATHINDRKIIST